MEQVEHGWAGIDAGKGQHHVVVIDQEGRSLLSRRGRQRRGRADRPRSRRYCDHGRQRRWAIDLADGAAALIIALLLRREQAVFYLPGIAVNRASAGYRGQAKTDAKDAAVIADQARMRRDLRRLSCSTTMLCSCS